MYVPLSAALRHATTAGRPSGSLQFCVAACGSKTAAVIIDPIALAAVVLLTAIMAFGVKESFYFNAATVAVSLVAIFLCIFLGEAQRCCCLSSLVHPLALILAAAAVCGSCCCSGGSPGGKLLVHLPCEAQHAKHKALLRPMEPGAAACH